MTILPMATMLETNDQWQPAHALAESLGISTRAVRAMVRRGELERRYRNGHPYVRPPRAPSEARSPAVHAPPTGRHLAPVPALETTPVTRLKSAPSEGFETQAVSESEVIAHELNPSAPSVDAEIDEAPAPEDAAPQRAEVDSEVALFLARELATLTRRLAVAERSAEAAETLAAERDDALDLERQRASELEQRLLKLARGMRQARGLLDSAREESSRLQGELEVAERSVLLARTMAVTERKQRQIVEQLAALRWWQFQEKRLLREDLAALQVQTEAVRIFEDD